MKPIYPSTKIKELTRKENYRLASFINVGTKSLNKKFSKLNPVITREDNISRRNGVYLGNAKLVQYSKINVIHELKT